MPLGGWEIAIVIVLILLVFGGKLIPRIGSSLGRSLVGLKKGIKEGEEEFKSAIKDDAEAGTKTDAKATHDDGDTSGSK